MRKNDLDVVVDWGHLRNKKRGKHSKTCHQNYYAQIRMAEKKQIRKEIADDRRYNNSRSLI